MSTDTKDLVLHVGHELKMLAFAVAHFRLAVEAQTAGDGRPLCDNASLPATHFIVPLQDSALARGRTLLDFLTNYRDPKKNLYIRSFYDPAGAPHPTKTPTYGPWLDFISSQLLHVGRQRINGQEWPGRPVTLPCDAEDDGRLDRLWGCVRDVMDHRVEHAPLAEEPKAAIQLMMLRATVYIDGSATWKSVRDNDVAFHTMDPQEILRSLSQSS